MNSLLILGAGQMQVPIIQLSKSIGLTTIVADYDPKAPGFKFADIVEIVSTVDFDAVLDVAVKHKINGILTTSDYPVNVVAQVASRLSLSAMSVDVAAICTNKYRQREIFKNAGIKTPFFKILDSVTDFTDLTDFPYIIKPLDSSASRGVKRIDSAAEFYTYYPCAASYSRNNKVIVEQWIEGREFSVETLTQDHETKIIAITEKITHGVVENIHIIPARITTDEAEEIRREVTRMIEAIGLNNCPSHTEIKINEKGVYPIEIACRLGGDYITSDLVPLATGVSLLGNLIRLSMGELINTQSDISKVAAVQFLDHTNYDLCKEMIETKNPNIVRYELHEKHDREVLSSLDRMGYLIFQTDTMAQMESLLRVCNPL